MTQGRPDFPARTTPLASRLDQRTEGEARALNENSTGTIQLAALTALAWLAQKHPDLPGGAISVHAGGSINGTTDVSLDSTAAFEAWRVALGWEPGAVAMRWHNSVWLVMEATFMGASIQVTMHGLPLSVEVVSVSPADDAAAAALVSLPGAWVAAGAA